MNQYFGQLLGGPDDGNFVTASTNMIPVTSTTEMRLDGDGEDKVVTIIVAKGVYVWQDVSKEFLWQFSNSNVYTKKMMESV